MTEFPVDAPFPGNPGSGRREALTVAQLLARGSSPRIPAQRSARDIGPDAPDAPGGAAAVVSVGSLLRREGRAPHAQDRPLQPRAARQAEQAAPAALTSMWPARSSSGRRRATAVAGALVATGSVLGAALYNSASSHTSDAPTAADGLFPGLGLPWGGTSPTLPPEYLPANVSLTGPLAAGALPASGADLAGLAFPGREAGPRATTAGATAATASSTMRGAVPEARSAVDTTPSPTLSGGGSGPTSGPTSGSPSGSGSGTGPSAAPTLLAPLTGGSPDRSGTPGASSGPLQTLAEPVRPITEAVAPVGSAVGQVVRPVTSALRPATTALQPVTKPVADAVEPVTTPVLRTLAPVTGPLLTKTAPLTDSLAPVTDLLTTSAGDREPRTGGTPTSSASSGGRHQVDERTDPTNTVTGLTTKLGGLLG